MKDIALHILDITENSITAGASLIGVTIVTDYLNHTFILNIEDNGRGMDGETLNRVTDPFYTTRTTRKVGLGLPLLRQNAEQTGGSLAIESTVGEGTRVSARFNSEHIDMIPVGDLPGVISLIAGINPSIDFVFKWTDRAGEFILDTREIKEVLGDVRINEPGVINYLKEMIAENLSDVINN